MSDIVRRPPLFNQLMNDAIRGLLGMERNAELTLACYLAKYKQNRQEANHVLCQASNGVAKSHFASNVNMALMGPELVQHFCSHRRPVSLLRVQGNPELLPSDLSGADMPAGGAKLAFKPGPLTAEEPPSFMVMADEINRTGPRTMSGWLQAMAEGWCTVRTMVLPWPTLRFAPGWVLATQNPSHHVGVYQLPEALYDRFMVMLNVAMTTELESVLLGEGSDDANEDTGPPDVAFLERTKELFRKRKQVLERAKADVGAIKLEPGTAEFIAKLCYSTWPWDAVRRLRLGIEDRISRNRKIQLAVEPLAQGVSPRAGKALRDLGCAMAWAVGQKSVSKNLIASIAEPVLAHRLVLMRSADKDCDPRKIVQSVVGALKES